MNVRPFEDVPDEHIKIKPRRHAQTPPALQQRAKQIVVVENEIARLQVREKFYETFGRANFAAKNLQNEFHVLCRKLHPAIGLDHLHGISSKITIKHDPRNTVFARCCEPSEME